MPRWLNTVYQWIDFRLGLRDALVPLMRHPTPRGARWWYVFGSATLTLFLIQIVTGIGLALVYVPSADQAYETLQYLNYDASLGWFIRALHNCSASGMVIMLVLHMTQVFLMGAFKYPREMTWLVGIVLLACTLAMCFSGQVLRWDQDAYWTVGVSAAMAGRVPVVGPGMVHLLLGGEAVGGQTLSRFFALHVFVVPAALIFFLILHLYLVLKHGISAPPVTGQPVDPMTYAAQYEAELKRGEPFFPMAVARDAIFSALTVVAVVAVSAWLGPQGPGEPPDPTLIQAEPRPDWYFLPLFALLALSPPKLEAFAIFGVPIAAFAVLALVPFVAGKGERSPRRRPVAVLSVLMIYLVVGVLGWEGYRSPWSPRMFAWSGTPVPVSMIRGLTPRELAGAAVFQNKTCRNCHALDGKGGKRGPDLTNVATSLTHDELIRQVIQGGGLMPAFGDQLNPAEVNALVSFLETLKPRGQPQAESPVAGNR
jgi:ubiquinol-cytochrome c reductase cytochrome b subunit